MPPKKSNHRTKASFDDIFDTQLNIDKLIEKAKKQGKSKIKIKIDGKEIEINLKENKDSIWNKILKITLGTAAAAGAGALAYYGYKNKDDLMKAVKDYYNTGKTKATEYYNIGKVKAGEMASDFTKFATDKYNDAKKFATKKYQQIDDYFHPKTALLPYYENPRETYNNDAFTPEYKIPLDYIKPGVVRDKIKLETGTDLIPYNPNSYDMHGPEYIPPWNAENKLTDTLAELKKYIEKTPTITYYEANDLLEEALGKLPYRIYHYPWLKPALKEFNDNLNKITWEQMSDFKNEKDINIYKENIYNALNAIEYLSMTPPYR